MTYAEIIRRLVAATGPDRVLDRDIYWLLRRRDAERAYWNGAMGMPRPLGDRLPEGLGRLAVEFASPPYTASLDETLSLVEEQLPGVWHVIAKGKMTEGEPLYGAILFFGDENIGQGETNASEAIALLLALFRALEAA